MTAVGGALVASGATLIQLGLITAVANPHLLGGHGPALVAGLAVIAVESALLYRRETAAAPPAEETPQPAEAAVGQGRPFALWPALALAAILTVVVLAARWGADVLGANGALLAATFAGLADVQAAVLAVATLAAGGTLSVHTALVASGLVLATNTASRMLSLPSPPAAGPSVSVSPACSPLPPRPSLSPRWWRCAELADPILPTAPPLLETNAGRARDLRHFRDYVGRRTVVDGDRVSVTRRKI